MQKEMNYLLFSFGNEKKVQDDNEWKYVFDFSWIDANYLLYDVNVSSSISTTLNCKNTASTTMNTRYMSVWR